MTSYLTIIYIPVIITYIEKNKKGLLLALGFLLLVSGLRYEFGADYTSYYSIFNNIKFNNLTDSVLNLEKSFLFLNKILIFFNLDFKYLFFVVTFFNLTLLYKIINYFSIDRRYYWLILFLYLSDYTYFFYHLSLIRQSIAIYIFLYSLRYIYEKNFFKYLLLILIATVFHKSAISLLIIYFIIKYLNEKLMFIMLVIGILIALNQNLIINTVSFIFNILRLETYMKYIIRANLNTGLGYIIRYIINIIISFFIILILKSKKIDKKEKFILKMYFLYFFFSIFKVYLSSTYHRFLCYFDWIVVLSYYILFKFSLKKFKILKKIRKILLFSIFIVGNLFFIKYYFYSINNLKDTEYLKYMSSYKCILFHKDIYKNKLFYRENKTGKVYFL